MPSSSVLATQTTETAAAATYLIDTRCVLNVLKTQSLTLLLACSYLVEYSLAMHREMISGGQYS